MYNLSLAAWLGWLGVMAIFIGIDLLKETDGSFIKRFSTTGKDETVWKKAAEIIGPSLSTWVPVINLDQIEQKLTWAGRPYKLTKEGFIGLKVMLLIAGVISGLFLALIGIPAFLTLVLAAVGYVLPDSFLNKTIEKRQNEIHRTLPDMTGLLATALKAGVELGPALKTVSENLPGVLGEEMRRTWREIATGRQKGACLIAMAKRTGLPIMERFVETIVTAEERGGMNISQSIANFRTDLLASQSRRAQEQARKLPTKMLVPIMLCIFLPMLAMLLVPIVMILITNL